MPTKRHWTEAENATVLRMIADGASNHKIAAAFNISLTDVRRQCEALGWREVPAAPGCTKKKKPITKTCTSCGEPQSLASFSPKKTGIFGVHSHCKACRAERNALMQKQNYIPTGKPRGRPRKVTS